MKISLNTNQPAGKVAFGTVIKLDRQVKTFVRSAEENRIIEEIIKEAAKDGLDYQLDIKKWGDSLKGYINGISKNCLDEVFLPSSFDSFTPQMSHRGLDRIPERIKNIYDNAVRTINSQTKIVKRIIDSE